MSAIEIPSRRPEMTYKQMLKTPELTLEQFQRKSRIALRDIGCTLYKLQDFSWQLQTRMNSGQWFSPIEAYATYLRERLKQLYR